MDEAAPRLLAHGRQESGARGWPSADLGAWEHARRAVLDDLLQQGFHRATGAFTQAYGTTALDASILALPLRNVLPSDDPRMRATVDRIAEGLGCDGLLHRYGPEVDDGLPVGEGAFRMLSFWLADCYAEMGRLDEARALFERLLGHANDVGLYAEEIDPRTGRHLGNYPQASRTSP